MGTFVTAKRPRSQRPDGGRRQRAQEQPKRKMQWALLIILGLCAGFVQHMWMSGKAVNKFQLSDISVIAATREVVCPACVGDDGLPRGGRPHPDNFSLWQDCPVCFGTGRRIIKLPNSTNQAVCPQCGGMGRYIRDGQVFPCDRCEEWGIIDTVRVERKIEIPDQEIPAPASDE